MSWHHKEVQIAVFCNVILYAVADMYWHFRGIHYLHVQDLWPKQFHEGHLLVGEGDSSLRAIKIFPNFTEPSLPCSHDAETDRNYISNYIPSNYIPSNSQGGMTVCLLELQPLKVLLPIPKITDERIWIMSRMVINRRNLT